MTHPQRVADSALRGAAMGAAFLLPMLLLAASSCAPDPCVETCNQAQAVFAGCLDAWGIDWTDAGYQDAEDYLDACLTWAWEMRILAEDAGEADAVDTLCEERTQTLEAGTCETYLAIDWNAVPWQ